MKNKTTETNNSLKQLSRENFFGYEFVDYWDGDTTALGLQKGNIVVYISTYHYSKSNHYDIIIEELGTGKILKSGEKISYNELIHDLQSFF
ncbi:hypothetical protein [Chryseobacterium sp. JV274]|jgi:hypothetical protein|uniref:hypothetical protein n=1 Tax=unclassified Chryseobacterium TaxID=2593645 RepID=UPI000986837F|nr:hypothetical protein [Chryseobacterium sp. JV274]CAD0222820.1 conserved protein of unknown function [Chryseobacterium sp. JV274]